MALLWIGAWRGLDLVELLGHFCEMGYLSFSSFSFIDQSLARLVLPYYGYRAL